MTGHMIPTQDTQGGGCGGGAGPSAVFLRFSLFQTTDAPSQGSKTLSLSLYINTAVPLKNDPLNEERTLWF